MNSENESASEGHAHIGNQGNVKKYFSTHAELYCFIPQYKYISRKSMTFASNMARLFCVTGNDTAVIRHAKNRSENKYLQHDN
jgi:hypothetical protein